MNMSETFTFTLNPASGAPVYRQIIQQVEHAILGGKLQPGDRLPTIRALAVALKANPNTIARAYNEMEIRGLVSTQVGSGTYISEAKTGAEDERKKKIDEAAGRFIREMYTLGVSSNEIEEIIRRNYEKDHQ
jgi:GntR family transcriptional regulator